MAVIGAGPAGSVCAYSALATSERMRVALIDREVFPRDKSCGDAIRHDAALMLRELDLGSIFDGRPIIRNIQATSPPEFRYLEMLLEDADPADPIGQGYYIIERKVFDHYLFEAAIGQGARDCTGYRLTDAEFDESDKLWNLALRGQAKAIIELRCRVLVGADGAGSRVRRLVGLDLNEDEHCALALRAYAQAEGLAERTLRIDWLKSLIPGYGWVFPLAEGKVNIGVIIDKRDFKRDNRRLESYLDEYVRYLGNNGVAISNLDDIKTHPLPLGSQSLPFVPRQQVALIGDAAAMINPFTGEGIQYGIWAGCSLGHAVGRCVNQGGSVQAALESYARAYTERFAESMKRYQSLRTWVRFQKFFV